VQLWLPRFWRTLISPVLLDSPPAIPTEGPFAAEHGMGAQAVAAGELSSKTVAVYE